MSYTSKKDFSKREFISFLKELRKNFIEDFNSWENINIYDFSEAMEAWVDEMEGFYEWHNLPLPTNISWGVFADFLMGAKLHE